jgi:hypothetical protein
LETLGTVLREQRLVDVAERNNVPMLAQRGSFRVTDDAGPNGEHMELLDWRLRASLNSFRHNHGVDATFLPARAVRRAYG